MLPQLRRNLALLYGAEVLAKVLALVVFGYLARTLLQVRYGDLEFSLGLLMVLSLVIDAGLGSYGARELAKHPEETDRLVGQVTLVRGVLTIAALALLAGVALVVAHDPLARTVILLQGLVLLPAPLVMSWVFQARDQMHVVAALNVIRQLLLTAGVFLFVKGPEDVWLVPAWDAVGLTAGIGLQIGLLRRGGSWPNPLRYVAGVRKVIVESAPLAGSSIVSSVRLYGPLLVLGVVATSAQVGIFGVGLRLVVSAHMFVWLYFFNLLPTLSRLADPSSSEAFGNVFGVSMRLVAWVATCGALLGTILAPEIIPRIFSEGMVEGVEPFAVLVWVLLAAFVSGHHRFGLIALSHQGQEFVAGLVGAVISVVGCAALASRLTLVSAAWVLVVAETTTFLLAAAFLRRARPELNGFAGLGRPFAFTAVVALGLRLWSPASPLVGGAVVAALYVAIVAVLERKDVARLLTLRTSDGAA